MAFGEHPAAEPFSVICAFKGLWLTKTGSLVGALELSGADPDAMTKADHTRLAVMTANIYRDIPADVAVTQYYIHYEGAPLVLRDRPGDPITHRLSKAREAALNERGLAKTRLIHFLEFTDPQRWNAGLLSTLARNVPRMLYDDLARRTVKALISAPSALILRQAELEQRAAQLRKALEDVAAKWSLIMDAEVMGPRQTWQVMRYFATLNNRYLIEPPWETIPTDDCDLCLGTSQVEPVAVKGVDLLKIQGSDTAYARLAAVVKTPKVPVGVWAFDREAPITQRGNYIFASHFSAMSEFKKTWAFRAANNRLERSRLDFKKMLSGEKAEDINPDHEHYAIRKKRAELERAEAIEDRFGYWFSQIVLYDNDPISVLTKTDSFDTAFSSRGMNLAWESAGLPHAWQSFQPGGQGASIRNIMGTTSRAACLSLVNRGSSGVEVVRDLGNEEPQYFFETVEGGAYGFSPMVGEKAFVISTGPIRSGKTYLKNTLATHSLKYGGFSRQVDIDPGSETIARFFGEQGAIVRLDGLDGHMRGLNIFASAEGPNDRQFIGHALSLAQELLRVNDTPELQFLTGQEQQRFDEALVSTLSLPREMWSLEHLMRHLPQETASKFSRWRAGGPYDGIFNARHDSIGDAKDKRIAVYNLQSYRDDLRVLRPMMLELFYRTTRLFESIEFRHVPKSLDVDEAHHPLKIRQFSDFLVSKVRTWAKFQSWITLWSQSPMEYGNIPDWHAVRSAASTFIFCADGRMDAELYAKVFDLTAGQIREIASLVPRREIFVVQPERGVSKKLILRPEPEQHIINTSNPNQVVLREQLIREYGFDEGLKRAAAILRQQQAEAAE